jgi:hypothetical protein
VFGDARDLKSLGLVSIDVSNSKFRQRPRMGHLLQSTRCRFTQLHQHRPCRKQCGWAGALKCLSGEAFRDWPDRKVTRVVGSSRPDYERRFRAPERRFSMETSRIEKKVIMHIRCGMRIFTLLCQVSPYGEINARYRHAVGASLRESWHRAEGEASAGVSSGCSCNLCASCVAG